MRTTRVVSLLLLASVLLGATSCTPDSSPLGPSTTNVTTDSPPALAQVSDSAKAALLGGLLDPLLPEPLDPVLDLTDDLLRPVIGLVRCTPQDYDRTTKVIGRRGGVIEVGAHRIVIPRGALRHRVRITAEALPDTVNSVRFSPHGLKFRKGVRLTMSYANCRDASLIRLPKRVAYVTESLDILSLLFSKDDPRDKETSTTIRHFSRYAVAW